MLRSAIWEKMFSIANSFDNVIFVSHEQEVIEKNKFGREISRFQPVFEDKLRDQMSGLMSVIARTVKSINEDGTVKYELHICNSDDEFGGTRLPIKSTCIPLDKKSFDENFISGSKKVEEPKRKSIIG